MAGSDWLSAAWVDAPLTLSVNWLGHVVEGRGCEHARDIRPRARCKRPNWIWIRSWKLLFFNSFLFPRVFRWVPASCVLCLWSLFMWIWIWRDLFIIYLHDATSGSTCTSQQVVVNVNDDLKWRFIDIVADSLLFLHV